MQQAIITRQPLAIGIEKSVSIKQFSIVLDIFFFLIDKTG